MVTAVFRPEAEVINLLMRTTEIVTALGKRMSIEEKVVPHLLIQIKVSD